MPLIRDRALKILPFALRRHIRQCLRGDDIYPELPNHTGALTKRAVRSQAQFMHCVENAAMHRFQTSLASGSMTRFTLGVFQVRLGHFVAQIGRDNPLLRGSSA